MTDRKQFYTTSYTPIGSKYNIVTPNTSHMVLNRPTTIVDVVETSVWMIPGLLKGQKSIK